jgi:hypothetical protein
MWFFALGMVRESTVTTAAPDMPAESSHSACLARSDTASRFQKQFVVGGLTLEINGDAAEDVDGGVELRQFEITGARSDIKLNVRWAGALEACGSQRAFESGATWRLSLVGDEFVFEFTSPLLGTSPYKQLRVDNSFSRADLILSSNALRSCQDVSPIEYPVCELLVTNYLAQHGLGVEVHGCGIVDQARGYLFLGHSGAGKSTTARLWDSFRRAQILSDDRLILRLHDGEVWMYGTPWHGEAAFATAGEVRLENIFVLRHGSTNQFMRLPKALAVGEIFARSFPPFHSAIGLERTVEFLKQVIETAPCFEFQFVPDQSAIASVLAFHE